MKISVLSLALAAALAAPSAFADNTATGNVYANVPSTCEILSIDDATANFGLQVTQTSVPANIQIICNLDAGYSLTATSVDTSGRFDISAVSGTSGATMEVELRESTTGSAWTSSDIVGGQGTGQVQFYPIEFVFNPAGSAIPAYGSYAGTVDIALTATL